MSVRKHRIAAILILTVEVVILLAWGRWMAHDLDDVRLVREELQGQWVATRIETGPNNRVEGKAAERCRVEFDGKNVVFQGMIDDIDARGTYNPDGLKAGSRVDFKLDAGWIIGLYQLEGDTLKLCINAFSLPERLGVPTRYRPKKIQAGDGQHLYVFHKVSRDSSAVLARNARGRERQ